MSSAAAATLRTLIRRYTPDAWTTPADPAGLHEQLVATLTTGAPFRGVLRYPAIDLDPLLAAARAARRASETIDAAGQDLGLRDTVLNEIGQRVKTAHVIASRDDDALAAHERAGGREPAPEVVEEALRIVTRPHESMPHEAPRLDAAALVRRIETVLDRSQLTGWQVGRHDDRDSPIRVHGGQHRVTVRTDLTVSDTEGDRLLAHAIGGRLLRCANAAEQPEPLAGLPLGNGTSEQSHAMLVAEQLGVSDPERLRTAALRVLAVHAGRTRTLVDLARHLTRWLPAPAAAALALRVRRGFVDPSTVGVRTQDHTHLSGLLELRRIAATRPEDLALVRATRWPHTWLGLLRDLHTAGRLHPPRWTPDPVLLFGGEYRRTGTVLGTRLHADRHWTTWRGTPMQSRAGDWWVVSPEDGVGRGVAAAEFAALYQPVGDGRYTRCGIVLAARMRAPWAVNTLEGPDIADPGEWVVQHNSPAHRWVVPHHRFTASYAAT